jgi:peptide/nickel transport system substrate-binding protein
MFARDQAMTKHSYNGSARAFSALLVSMLALSSAHGEQAPVDTILSAVAATPTALAADAAGQGYENLEYNHATTGKLFRNPYVKTPYNAYDQDITKFEPFLAEGYDVSPDGLVYTIRLKKGVLSHSLNELSTDDVLWSYERKWKSTATTSFVNAPIIVDPGRQFQKIDRYTFSITLARKSDGFTLMSLLSNTTSGIYDSTLLKQHVSSDDPYAVKWSANNGGFGFGPYMLKSFTPGQELVLVANPNYVLGKPKINRIIERVVGDPGTRANLLRNGDVDVAVQLRPADIVALSKGSNIDTFTLATNNVVLFFMQTRNKPFNDIAVRKAIQYAIPYQRIIDEVYKGRADLMKGLINPIFPLASDGLPERGYDPEKSKEILKAAGYEEPVRFTVMLSNAVPDLQETFLQIQTYAAAAGFDIKANIVPPAAVLQALPRGTFEANIQRDMAIVQSPPYELMLFLGRGSPYNRSKWEDEDYYGAVNSGIEAGDPLSPEAAKHWNHAQRIWRENVPYITLMSVEPLMAFNKRVQGFAHRSDNVIDFSLLSKH